MIPSDVEMMIMIRLMLVENISNNQEYTATIGTDIGGNLVLVSGIHCRKQNDMSGVFENIQGRDLLENVQWQSVNCFPPRFYPADWSQENQQKPLCMVVVAPCSMKVSITCTPGMDIQTNTNAVYPYTRNGMKVGLSNARIKGYDIGKNRVTVETTENKHAVYPGLPFFDDKGRLIGVTVAVENIYNCKRVILLRGGEFKKLAEYSSIWAMGVSTTIHSINNPSCLHP